MILRLRYAQDRPRKHTMQFAPKYSHPEVERRWLVPLAALEALAPHRSRRIEDHYIAGTELRLRAVHEEGCEPAFKLGKKYARSLEGQPVVSVYLSDNEFTLLSRLPARSTVKQRLSIAGGALDVYVIPRHGFAIFEVEFSSIQESAEYTLPPSFVGKEVTGQSENTGHALAANPA